MSDISDYTQDGPIAKKIAATIPYYKFKGIPRFYDINGFLVNPDIFQLVVDVFASRYKDKGITSIGGFDARGFVIGAPLALALKVPFFMLRKPGKQPNSIASDAYNVEYGKRSGMTIPRGMPLDASDPLNKSTAVKDGSHGKGAHALAAGGKSAAPPKPTVPSQPPSRAQSPRGRSPQRGASPGRNERKAKSSPRAQSATPTPRGEGGGAGGAASARPDTAPSGGERGAPLSGWATSSGDAAYEEGPTSRPQHLPAPPPPPANGFQRPPSRGNLSSASQSSRKGGNLRNKERLQRLDEMMPSGTTGALKARTAGSPGVSGGARLASATALSASAQLGRLRSPRGRAAGSNSSTVHHAAPNCDTARHAEHRPPRLVGAAAGVPLAHRRAAAEDAG